MEIVSIRTVEGGGVALECDFEPSNPAPQVVWRANGGLIVEDPNGLEILYLEEGRFLYIRRLTAQQRLITLRYYCEVTNFRDENGVMPIRAPTTYTVDVDLQLNTLVVYKELGTQLAGVGDLVKFYYVYGIRNQAGNFQTIGFECPPDPENRLSVGVNRYVFSVNVLAEPTKGIGEIEFTCNQLGSQNTITGTVKFSSTCVSLSILPVSD